MDNQLWLAVAALAATALGSAGVLGQIAVARRQANLQEATAYREQATAWSSLQKDWQLMLLAGLGPSQAISHGVDTRTAERYREQLETYRLARVASMEAMVAPLSDEKVQNAVWEAEALARAAIAPVEDAVRRVLVHFAQLASLVLNRRLSVAAVYDSVGHDVLREHAAIVAVTRYAYDYGGCIAPMNEEGRAWASLTADEVSPRIGWARALRASVGTLDRIDVLVDMLILHAEGAGDQGDFNDGGPIVDEVGSHDLLAYRWKTLRKTSRLEAMRFCLRAAWFRDRRRHGPGGVVQSIRFFKSDPSWAAKAPLRTARWLAAPLFVGVTVLAAAFASDSAQDPGRWLKPVGWVDAADLYEVEYEPDIQEAG